VPDRLPHGCAKPGCPELVRGAARCPEHTRALRAEIDSTRPCAARRGYDAAWRRLRLAHLRRRPTCAFCEVDGRTTPATDVDHVIPLARGGTNTPRNLQSLCHEHHASKTAREDGRWGRRRTGGAPR
jgi:5-methylcytosine-specific restriction protein A